MTRMTAVLTGPALLLVLAAVPLAAQEEVDTEPTSQPTTQPAGEEAAEGGGHEVMMAMCPMHVDGTVVAVEDTGDGAALVFTNEAQVDELRSRIHRMADFHNAHHAAGVPDGMPAAQATAEDIDGGCRLVLVPADAANADWVRQHLHEHAGEMAAGRCPMGVLWGGHEGNAEGEGGGEEE